MKKTQIFHFFLPPEKCEWKTDKFDQKLAKSVGNICLRDIKNFWEKIT